MIEFVYLARPDTQISGQRVYNVRIEGNLCPHCRMRLTTEFGGRIEDVPVERIQQAVKPNEEQQANLQRLQEAANKAVGTMQAACPDETPSSPVGRLDAMEKRLQAMLDAAQTIKPPLNAFYSSLSDDQKARMNAVGRDLASNG